MTNTTDKLSKAVLREQETVATMIAFYCRKKHGSAPELCTACQGLREYATRRIEHCMFQPDKPTCGKCPVHCYEADRREEIRQVMRFAGPRLLFVNPAAAIRHLGQTFRKPSERVIQVAERKALRANKQEKSKSGH